MDLSSRQICHSFILSSVYKFNKYFVAFNWNSWYPRANDLVEKINNKLTNDYIYYLTMWD